MTNLPTLQNVIEAQQRISNHITRTPLHHYPALDELLGAKVYVKHENHQLLGAFKMRGALNVVSQLTEEEKRNGVISASTGNFGQGIAYAARLLGVKARVIMPNNSNPDKIKSMKRLGAEVLFHGNDFDDALGHAKKLSDEQSYRYIHSANEPGLIPGVGTYTLEIIEDLPDVEIIIVPIGGGSGACGACIVAKSINPEIKVYGVQAENAPAAYLSWKKGRLVESPMETEAEGLATRSGYEWTQNILQSMLDDFILVSENQMEKAVVMHLEKTHNLTEHAGAASLAAAVKIKNKLKGKNVALVMSGSNITITQLKSALKT